MPYTCSKGPIGGTAMGINKTKILPPNSRSIEVLVSCCFIKFGTNLQNNRTAGN